MKESSPSPETGRARRVFVTLVIGTAAAAVTAGVALNERHPGQATVQRPEAGEALTGAADLAPAAPVRTRREQWRDPWKRPALMSQSASASIGRATDAGKALVDPSLPPASEALEGAAGASGESAPTF